MAKKKAKTKLIGDELRSKLAERARRMPWRQFSDSLLPDEHRELTFFGGSVVDFWRTYNTDETLRRQQGASVSHAKRGTLPELAIHTLPYARRALVVLSGMYDRGQLSLEEYEAAQARVFERWPSLEPKKSHAQIKREVDEILAGKRSRGHLSSEDARRLKALPDAAICNASQGGSHNLWYATVALDTRWPSDPDFLTTRKTKQAAIHDCAAKVRGDLHGEGKYAPHWSDYDVTYRLLPYWEQRRS